MKHRKERAALGRMFIDLACDMRGALTEAGDMADYDMMLVGLAVVVGHAEGSPLNAVSVAHWLKLPRETVRRKLKRLAQLHIIERHGRVYWHAKKRALNQTKVIDRHVRSFQKAIKAMERP
jgi:hypothetical protein